MKISMLWPPDLIHQKTDFIPKQVFLPLHDTVNRYKILYWDELMLL